MNTNLEKIEIQDYLRYTKYITVALRDLENAYNEGKICRETFPVKEVVEFVEYCDGYFSSSNIGSEQTRISYAFDLLKIYQSFDERQKDLWYEFVVRKDYRLFYQTSSINYKITVENIFYNRYTFIKLESYLMMFDLIKSKIESQAHGYKSKKLKDLVCDFAKSIREEYLEEFKQYVIKTMGKDGKKYLMSATLGGK